MVYGGTIKGKYIDVRSIVEADAGVTMQLRQNKGKTRFLHPVDNDIEKQRLWIKEQNNKEGDYFFLGIDKKTGKAIGTFGVYEIENGRGHGGRLLMYGNALQSFEIYYLVLDFTFNYLGLKEIFGDIDEKNISAKKFNAMFGFKFKDATYDLELNRMVQWCTLTQDEYKACLPKIQKLIYRNCDLPVLPW